MSAVVVVITVIFSYEISTKHHSYLITAAFDCYSFGTVLIRYRILVVIKSHK